MEGFVDAFSALSGADVPSLDAWRAFVDGHVANPGEWEGTLHFDHVLSACFGFDATTAAELRRQKHEETDSKTGKVEVRTLEEFSVTTV